MNQASNSEGLHRILGVWDGLAVGVGIVIGVGILRTPGLIAGYLGSPELVLSVWVFGGVVALVSATVFAEMAAMFPEAGGKFAYARRAFGPLGGFVAGWSEVIVTRGFSAASKAIVIGEYIILLGGPGGVRSWAALIIAGFFILHLLGLQAGRMFQNSVTALKVLFILAIVAAGFMGGDAASWRAGVAIAPERGLLLGFALAYLSVSFTYYGWDDAVKMAEEIQQPETRLPRILILGLLVIGALYLSINLAFMTALSPAEMAGSPLVAADAVGVVFGESGRIVITVASIVILVSSLNVNFLGLPRVVFGLARRGLAPVSLLGVGATGTPWRGLVMITLFIFVLAMTRSFEFLIQFMMFVAISVDTMILLALFRLRRLLPEAPRPFRVPGYPLLPAVTVILYVMILVLVAVTQPRLAIGGIALVGGLVAAGAVWTRSGRVAPGPEERDTV